MQQEAVGPDLDILLLAANTPRDGGYFPSLPAPDDRHNISISDQAQPFAAEYEARQFPPNTPKGSSFIPRADAPAPGPAPAFRGGVATGLGGWGQQVSAPAWQAPHQYPYSHTPPHPHPAFYGSPQPSPYNQGHPSSIPNQYVPQPAQFPYHPRPQHPVYAPPPAPPPIVPQGHYGAYPHPVPQQIHHQLPMQQGPYPQAPFLQGNVYVIEEDSPPNADLAGDPNYFPVRAQVEGGRGGNDTRTTCFTSLCINLSKVSYKAAELCLSPLIPRRNGVPSDSLYMLRAFVTGWAMLSNFVFPLVPNHYLRTLWVLVQLLFAIAAYGVSYSVSASIQESGSVYLGWNNHFVARNILAIFAIMLAIMDLICCLVLLGLQCLRNRTANSEAQPLVPRQQRKKGILSWFSKYNDILRLAISEMFLYGGLICSLPITAQELHNQPIVYVDLFNQTTSAVPHPQHLAHLEFAMFIYMVVGFVLLVYIVQLLALARMLVTKSQLTPHSPAKRKSFLLFLHLVLQYIGQRTIQVVMLTTFVHVQVSSPSDEFNTRYLDIVFMAYLTPVITLLTSFVLYYGWIEDTCTTRCMDYLQGLDRLSSNPQTSRATKEEINRILAFYDYQNTSREVSQFSQRNFLRNYLYPLQSPLTMLLCLPALACLATYFARLFADIAALEWVIPQVIVFVLIDVYLVFVLLCLLIFLPVSLFALVCRIARKRH